MKPLHMLLISFALILAACGTPQIVPPEPTPIPTSAPTSTATPTTAPTLKNAGDPIKVLFIGSSHIYYANSGHDLPGNFIRLAEAGGYEVVVGRASASGMWLMEHVEDPKTTNKIKSEDWDYIVLQEDMYLLAKEDQRQEYSYPAFRALNELIEGTGAETLLFATWVNPQSIYDGDYETYLADQVNLMDAYQEMADELDATLVPAGMAFLNALEQDPNLTLWAPGDDHGHASSFGSYLTASVFYAQIFQESPEGLSFVYTPEEISFFLQSIAAETILSE